VFVSLGMSGSFIEVPKGRSIPHQHLTWSFKGRAETLGYVDPRRFGFLTTTAPHPAPSPLDPAETAQALLAIKGQGSRRRLRDVLLDQKILGGVGNIYMCEACFAAGVDPLAEMASITPQRIKRLATALASILDRAIALGGSSISTYRQFGGAQGGAQDVHRVYGREGEPCKGAGCPGIVIRRSVGGRSVFLCPRCQK
jgi:formamidopyrimidine-DNA glycosylase